MRLVLDCSVAIKWFVPETDSDIAEQCLIRQEAGELSFVAPDILVAEIGHTLRKHILRGDLALTDGMAAFADLGAVKIELFPSGPLARDALTMAIGHSGTFYDALYITLALREDLRVVTADERMTRVRQADAHDDAPRDGSLKSGPAQPRLRRMTGRRPFRTPPGREGPSG